MYELYLTCPRGLEQSLYDETRTIINQDINIQFNMENLAYSNLKTSKFAIIAVEYVSSFRTLFRFKITI